MLAFDGPGQGEAPIRGVKFTPTAWVEAGEAIMEWCRQRPRGRHRQIVGFGLSFGSYWMSQIAATQPRARGCGRRAGAATSRAGHMIFEMASPSFKARYMWMSGLERDEAAFDEMASEIDLRPLIGEMSAPWLVIAGDEDELSPMEHSYDLAARCRPRPRCSSTTRAATRSRCRPRRWRSGRTGSPTPPTGCRDRVDGKPAEDVVDYVLPTGQIERRSHPKEVAPA